MHIQNHAPVDRAGMHAREHVVDILKPLGGDGGTHLSRSCELKCLLQVETGANDRAPHRNAFSTMSKIGSGKLPGGNPLSEMVPPRRTMPSACSKAIGDTAVTSTPWAPPMTSGSRSRPSHRPESAFLASSSIILGNLH